MVILRQACGLQVFPVDLEITTITSITPTCLGHEKAPQESVDQRTGTGTSVAADQADRQKIHDHAAREYR